MKKEKKRTLIEDIRSIFANFSVVIIANLSKIDATEFNLLRSALWIAHSDLKIAKNSLLKIVLSDHCYAEIAKKLNKEVGIFYSNDVVSLSKLLYTFTKGDDRISVINMVYENSVFCQDKIKKIASLPDILTVQSQLISMLNYGVGTKLSHILKYTQTQIFNAAKFCAND